ncbi:glycoside hydrolase family 25 protein [Lactarius hengduanensis]|nr:glycoside hydrolase family 25 protein [Lactarius hengduanensis]
MQFLSILQACDLSSKYSPIHPPVSVARRRRHPHQARTVRRLVKRADPEGIDAPLAGGPQLEHDQVRRRHVRVHQGDRGHKLSANPSLLHEPCAFIDPNFSSNYAGATNAGANYFLAHGGGWSGDGITLPGAIDLEAGCYGLTHAQMVTWIKDFSNTYHSKTTRYPAIYTTTSWWTSCTGNSASFGTTNPLWIAHWASSIGTLPAGWSFTTFWQYADSGPHPGDQDKFNGDAAGLKRMALG